MSKESLEIRSMRSIIDRLCRYSLPYKRKAFIACLCLALAVVAEMLAPLAIKALLDDYLTQGKVEVQPYAILAGSFMLLTIFASCLHYFNLFLFQWIGLQIVNKVRQQLYQHVIDLPLRFFDKKPTGSLISRMTNDTENISMLFSPVVPIMLQGTALIIGTLIAIFILDTTLGFISLAGLVIVLIATYLYVKFSRVHFNHYRELVSDMNAQLNENLQGMNLVQQYNQEPRIFEKFQQTGISYYKARKKIVLFNGVLTRPLGGFLMMICIAAIVYLSGSQGMVAGYQVGMIYTMIYYIERLFQPVFEITQQLNQLQSALISSDRVFDLLDEKIDPLSQVKSDHQITHGKVDFTNVSMKYDDHWVLQDIHLTVKPNQFLAIVGHTGSGKSSMINLLMRFYPFQEGKIEIDHQSINDFTEATLRTQVGLVFQEPFVFSGTIAENIQLFKPEISQQQVEQACRTIGFHDFICQLPGGYQYQLQQRGTDLSTGQKQLLAFARVLAHNPKILILDEATASIDSQTESMLKDALLKVKNQRTIIAIAHRLATIQDADEIIVLDQGRIIERGHHDQLLAQKGKYWQLYQSQQDAQNEQSAPTGTL